MRDEGEQGGVDRDAAVERAREIVDRYGSHAADYVESRIEASHTSGESKDVRLWQRVSELVAEPDED